MYQHHMLCWERLVSRGQRAGSRSLISSPVTPTAKYEFIYTYMLITCIFIYISIHIYVLFLSLRVGVCVRTHVYRGIHVEVRRRDV